MPQPSSTLTRKAAGILTEKAAEIAGGFVGGRAGEAAGEAVRRFGPQLRTQFRRSARLAQKDPAKVLGYALVGAALVAGFWIAAARAGRK